MSNSQVHWIGDAPTSLHGNGAASFKHATRDPAEVTCSLCRSLLAIWNAVEREMDRMIEVDGYTAADPVPDEDWNDEVRRRVNRNLQERRFHNSDGFMCYLAGDPECLALGHKPDPDGEWYDGDLHVNGWNGDTVCPETRWGTACTECETETGDCDYEAPDVRAFWDLFAEREVKP